MEAPLIFFIPFLYRNFGTEDTADGSVHGSIPGYLIRIWCDTKVVIASCVAIPFTHSFQENLIGTSFRVGDPIHSFLQKKN